MKLLPISLLVLSFLQGKAQDFVEYYQQLNEAKLLAVNGKFEASSQLFELTFREFDFKYARDCIHAVETAALTTDTALLGYLIQTSLRQGISVSYFEEKDGLEWFRKTESWVEALMRADSLHQVYEGSVNQELRAEVNQMFADDQEIREKYYRWYNFLGRPIIGKKWRKLNEKQIERLIDITREYGFPGEQLIGIDVPAHHPKISATQFSAGIPIVLLVHHYSKANPSYDPILFEQLKVGYLYNEHFATICDFQGEFGRKKHEKFGFYGLRFGQKGRKENMYDAKRADVGLMTYLQYKKLNQSTVYTKFWNRLK